MMTTIATTQTPARTSELLNRELARPGSELARIDLNGGRFERLHTFGVPRLSRPLLLGAGEIRALGEDLMVLVGLLTTAHLRLFDGDPQRLATELGIPEVQARLMCRPRTRPAPPFGRIDAYHDGESLKVLEVNASSDAGGAHWVSEIPEALQEFPHFREFAGTHGLRHTDTVGMLADALREVAAPVTSGHDPVVAVLEGPGGLAEYGDAWRPLTEALRLRGLDCHLGEITEVTFRDGRVLLGDVPVDVVFRVFSLDQVTADAENSEKTERLLAAHEDGRVALWITPQAGDNKRFLAHLSDPRLRGHLSDEERRVVDRRLPWTRALPDAAALDGDRELAEQLRDERERLILKPDTGFGGQGIVRGWETDDDAWWRALRAAAAGGAVVQRRVVPRAERLYDPATGRTADWEACWGMFYLPSGYAGGGGRLIPVGAPSDIPLDQRRVAGLFLCPDDATGAPAATVAGGATR
ncbi:hypothetical protein [Streptomyces griseus]|uniref:hypothetical protein n=1 Tax=Streptomyces griseus TaxID=1911 RepID=UPI00365D7CBF